MPRSKGALPAGHDRNREGGLRTREALGWAGGHGASVPAGEVWADQPAAAQLTVGFQSWNIPFGLCFQTQAWSS